VRPVALVVAVCALLGGLVGCTRDEPARPAAQALVANAPDALTLDARADGARLLGSLVPVVEGADADRVLVLRVEGARAPSLDGARVLDARFVGEGLVTLGTDHVLRFHPSLDAQSRELDRGAEAPLSVRGLEVAYVRGEMPFFEVALADTATGGVRALTEGFAPAWSPALDGDGSVVFVSSRDGSPRLYRAARGGGVQALAPSARFPTSPFAPVLEGGRLRFADEQGQAEVELASGRVVGAP
jgi:hypothetical protein